VQALLKSLITQLCPRNVVPHMLQTLFDKHNGRYPAGKPDQAELENVLVSQISREYRPKIVVHVLTFVTVVKHSIYLIIDGIDEVVYGQERRAVLRFIKSLLAKGFPNLHVLFTSRPESDILREVAGIRACKVIQFPVEAMAKDIKRHVSYEIESDPSLGDLPANTKTFIADKLCQHGKYMCV
jgi:hypothetical protein